MSLACIKFMEHYYFHCYIIIKFSCLSISLLITNMKCVLYSRFVLLRIAMMLGLKRSSGTAEKERVSCPHGGGLSPQVHSPSTSCGYTYAYGRIRNPQQMYVKSVVRKAHFKLNRAFKVIQGYPYLCRQESRAVYCRNVQLMPTLFLKLTKI